MPEGSATSPLDIPSGRSILGLSVVEMDYKPTSLRLPTSVLKRADALLKAQRQAHQGLRIERATILRLALIQGIEAMERALERERSR